jgi:putative nucleotidyltransferase with HDIG domain
MREPTIRVDVADLTLGMYIVEIDRPWLESPFLFQGFPINNQSELDEVRQVCEYVFVDPEKSTEDVRPNLRTLASKAGSRNTSGNTHLPGAGKARGSGFHEQLYLARRIYNNTRGYVLKTYQDVRAQRAVDIGSARKIVTELTDNISINPHAMMWLTYLKERHEYTLTHSINVCILALTFGRHMKLHRSELELLGLGALLHDIGKLRIPNAILDKPGKLTPEEFAIMKTHPQEGYNILKVDKTLPIESLEIVLHHHERVNGNGYPGNFKSDEITLITKMASIVDVYDAITSDRCYHDGISPYLALQNIYSWAKNDFDKPLVQEFMSCMGLYPVGTIVVLSNGQTGIVISNTHATHLRPMVMLIKDSENNLLDQRKIFNLSTQKWDEKTSRVEIKSVIEPKVAGINVRSILEQESLSPNYEQELESLQL